MLRLKTDPPARAEWLVCSPCWEGDACEHYADYYSPRFLVHATTVVLRANSTGIVYRSWSTDEDLGLTCPLGPGNSARCPCAAVAYQLFAPPGDHHFQLDAVTGFLTRNTSMSLEDGKTYTYKIMVQSEDESHCVGGTSPSTRFSSPRIDPGSSLLESFVERR
ncbi:hypothetical protein C7M84_023308 [Penaeus vannamei]|uniref:Uncharacterized protein n=1 Tax=Penaeus vannamei TaxID=6689 RepID=A0A423U4A8_PENVA|nr:hypothetical protein C7M84_023308 [Penaeus vannamei]